MHPLLRWAVACLCAAPALAQPRPAPQRPATEMERAVDEFKIQTRNLGIRPDSPRRQGALRGASRGFHGRLFENFRNDALDAVPHEIRQRGGDKSLLRRNQFGFNVGGPVMLPGLWRPRNTFFSVSYEGVRESISRTFLRTIPTLPERTGDYSEVVDQAGNLLSIFDPASTRLNPIYDPSQPVSRDNLQYPRDPFPENRIPARRLDPVAQKALPFYPAPNTNVGPFFRNNFFINAPETNLHNGMIAKLDHSIQERHRLTVEIAYSNGFLGSARWFPNAANPGPSDRRFNSRRGQAEHTFTLSAHSVNTLTFEAHSDTSRSGELDERADLGALLNLRGISGRTFPVFSFPYVPMGRSYPLSKNARTGYSMAEGISTRRGVHNLRFAATHYRQQVNTFWPQYPSGSFRFTSGLTSLPGIINTGHGFASFLLGLADYAETSIVTSPSYFRRSISGLSLRDRWEARKGLTISFGARLERSTPRVEKHNRQSTVDLSVLNPANGHGGALVAATPDRRSFQPARTRLEPSLSIAWNPRGDTKTVVRASYARSYAPIPVYSIQWGTQGFNLYPTYISPNVQLQPAVVLADGLPAPDRPVPDLRPEAANDTVADLIDPSDRMPVYQSASLTVEREIPWSLVVSLGGAYSGGRDLLVGNWAANPNAIPLEALQYRDRLNDERFNRSLRPYPQYKGFDVYSSWPAGRYQRDAAFLRVEKRASQGLALSASYEFAKQVDDYSGPYGKQYFFSRENEWSLTAGHPAQRFYLTYTYELPLGVNKPWLNFSDWRRFMLEGWSVTGSTGFTSGEPLALRPEFNNTGGVVPALRVNTVAGVDAHVPDPSPHLWFNPGAFDQPADFKIGDAARTHPTLRAPGSQNHDLSLNKRFPLAADRTVEFSLAAFNVVNHANWNDPDVVIGPASAPNVNAGKIIGSRGGRVIQLGLRFSF